MKLALRIVGISARLLMVLGLVCLLLGGYLSWQTLSFVSGAERVTGKVVSYHEYREGGELRFRPRVRFVTPGGNIHTVAGQMGYTGKRYAVGTELPVVYQPQEPQSARIATFVDNWLGASVAWVVGLLCLVAGWFVGRSLRRGAG